MISLLIGITLFGAEPNGPVLLIPGKSSANQIHFSVSLGGQPADDVWSEFLNHWMATFDLNRDTTLSRDEADAVPNLANATGSQIRLEFSTADANGDGSISRDELQDFYRLRGLCGVNATPAAREDLAIETGQILWELLDHDHDGQLSRDELDSASHLLNRWDRNEDECLSLPELPTLAVSNLRQRPPAFELLTDSKPTPDTVTIPLRLDAGNQDPSDSRKSGDDLPAGLEHLDKRRIRVRLTSTTIVVQLAETPVQKIAAAQQYLLGEINGLPKGAEGFPASQIRSDPTLDWLAPLMKAVDTDHNETLSEPEIKSFIALLTEGAAAQVSITVTNRGRNLFDLLDANADNRLQLSELISAKNHIVETKGREGLSGEPCTLARDCVPWSVVVHVRRGPVTGRFGRLRIATRAAELRSDSSVAALPRWFRAMDRNRDQILSPFEFLGSSHRFQELDRNSDGVITSDESLILRSR